MISNVDNIQLKQSETELIAQLKAGDHQAFEELIRTYNQRLFRIARSIVREDMEAEDIVQEAYIKAFTRLNSFEGVDGLGSWLARVTANLAIDRVRKSKRSDKLINDLLESASATSGQSTPDASPNYITPERQAAMSQIRALLEREIDNLPDGFREVFVLRMVEELSITKTSHILDIPEATVKSRLYRARAKLQNSIKTQLTKASLDVFPFAGARCDRITAHVLRQLETTGIITRKGPKSPG